MIKPILRTGVWLTMAFAAHAQTYQYPVPYSGGLSGTFGEMRTNHFHFGLDIRVREQWGLPIYAARDGYVSRARAWYNGYGKALYITHPDGYSTVYGHIERFGADIEARLHAVQGQKRQFNQDLYFQAGEFPVKQGQIIGYSGSTGASTGPHLHFEIRDPQERILNPLAFFKDKFFDVLPPFITRIGFEPLDAEARVNGRFEKWLHYPAKGAHGYHTPGVVELTGRVGFEFTAYDRLAGAPNYNGFYRADLFLDDTVIFAYVMDRFGFEDSRYVLRHVDNEFQHNTGGVLQKCYVDEGNRAPIYRNLRNRGVLELKDDAPHQLRLEIRDLHGNLATHVCTVRRRVAPDVVKPGGRPGPITGWSVRRQTLILQTAPHDTTISVEYNTGLPTRHRVTYTQGHTAWTLVPLTPDRYPVRAVAPNGSILKLPFRHVARPGAASTMEWEGRLRAYFGAGALFDVLYLDIEQQEPRHPNACSAIYRIGSPGVGLYQPVALRLFADRNIERFAPYQRMLIELREDGTFNRWATDSNGATLAKRLGRYILLGDDRPPTVAPQNFHDGKTVTREHRKLTFLAKDDIAEIDPFSIELTIDGQWAVAEYYEYSHLIVYFLPATLSPGPHTLALRVADNARNVTTKSYKFVLK